MGNNRHKKNTPKGKQIKASPKENEYDLDDIFKKISSISQSGRKTRSSSITGTNYVNYQAREQNKFIGDDNNNSQQTYSGGTSRDDYYRLEDKISTINDQNNKAQTDLRRELEDKIENLKNSLEPKIDKCLSVTWYRWTIAALVFIAGLFYTFSYSDIRILPEKVQENKNNIELIKQEVSNSSEHNIVGKNMR